MRKKSLKSLLIVMIAITVFAAACGNDDSSSEPDVSDDAATDEGAVDDGTTEDGATDESTSDDPPVDEPSDGPSASFVYAMPFGIFDLDPSSSFGTENIVLQNVYETLTVYNPPGSDELLSPGLATSWESKEEATVWTFNLRPDVTFHDGTPMTAESVVASLNRTIDLGLGAAFIFFPVLDIVALDELTVEFTLEFPAPLDLALSSNYGAYIMSAEASAQSSDWFNAGNAAGTGPYTITSFDPVGSTLLTAFDGYWGGWESDQIAEVDVRLVEDPVLAEQLVRNGDADYTYNLPFDSYNALEGVDGVSVVRGVSMTNLFGLLNHERLSPELREALVLSFPYDDVASALYGGEATRAKGIVPRTVWGAANDLVPPETDLDAAAALVAAAGAEGTQLTYSYDAGTVEQEQIGEVWKAQLATIDIDLVLDPLTFDARLEIAQSDPANAQDIFTMFWFPTFVTPMDFLFSLFATEEEPFFNLGYYSNDDFDAAIFDADAITATDLDGAVELFQQAQRILVEDNAAVFMLDVPDVSVIASDVSGHVPNPAYSNVVRFYQLTRG